MEALSSDLSLDVTELQIFALPYQDRAKLHKQKSRRADSSLLCKALYCKFIKFTSAKFFPLSQVTEPSTELPNSSNVSRSQGPDRSYIVQQACCIMFFNSSSSTNASNGIFNDVGGNQNSVYYISNNYGPTIQLSVFAASPCHLTRHLPRKPNNNQSSDSTAGDIITLNHSSVAVIIRATIGHIVQITDLMLSRRVPSSSHLVPELKLLQQTLILYELAIEAYTDSPLCRGLANTITPAVERCSVVLKEIRDKISSTSLKFISITDMCRSVWWNGWDENELMSLKRMVSGVRAPLSDMLLALNS